MTRFASLLWLATAALAVFNALFGFAFPGIFEAVGTDEAAGHALFITVSLLESRALRGVPGEWRLYEVAG